MSSRVAKLWLWMFVYKEVVVTALAYRPYRRFRPKRVAAFARLKLAPSVQAPVLPARIPLVRRLICQVGAFETTCVLFSLGLSKRG